MDHTTDTLQIKISTARALLSKESREAIDAVDWKPIIEGMSKKYDLDQIEILETETELLLAGLLKPDNYPKELENRMRISGAEANSLVNEMDRLVFKKIQKELESRINPQSKNVSAELQGRVTQSTWKENLYAIAQKYKLSISQMGILEDITNKFLLGTINADFYEKDLKIKLGLTSDKSSELMVDVNEKILKNIRESLKTHLNKEEATVNMEDEVPIPPYAHPAQPVSTIVTPPTPTPKYEPVVWNAPPKTESGIYKKAGIEMLENQAEPQVTPAQTASSSPSVSSVPVQPKASLNNIISNKLGGVTVQKPSTSDYSRPLIATEKEKPLPIVTPSKSDPYHESID